MDESSNVHQSPALSDIVCLWQPILCPMCEPESRVQPDSYATLTMQKTLRAVRFCESLARDDKS